MKKKGFTLIELLVVISIIALLMGILMPALNRARLLAIQMLCGTNLKGVNSAMLVYTRDNDEDYPRAGGPGSVWATAGKLLYWDGGLWKTEDEAFGIGRDADGEVTIPGKATITSSLFLLVKYAGIPPRQFVCKGDDGCQEFKMSLFPYAMIKTIKQAWDFGDGSRPNRIWPGEFVSYAYQIPYTKSAGSVLCFGIVEQSTPSTPVCADRNPSPYLDKNAVENQQNASAHREKGQNVAYKDGSAKFEPTPNVGLAEDNIYTYEDNRVPTRPGQGFPDGDRDAYLVSERNSPPP
ncbi:MAG: type II secretion system protein [Planctomycetota bacterium]|jgi:prepilin-type N-terminal cleavage/methylation domain-containing protein